MMLTKVIGIYKCSLPWCHFWSSVRDLLLWKMCSFTKLSQNGKLFYFKAIMGTSFERLSDVFWTFKVYIVTVGHTTGWSYKQ